MSAPLRCDIVFQAVLSMDSARPLWIYFAIAIPCTVITVTVLVVLNWISRRRKPPFKLFSSKSMSHAIYPTGTVGRSDTELKEELEEV